MSLTNRILIGMVAGILLGSLLNVMLGSAALADSYRMVVNDWLSSAASLSPPSSCWWCHWYWCR